MNKAIKAWLSNPETFLRRLGEGQEWEDVVAAHLKDEGFEISVPERTAYEGPQRGKFANAHDVMCNGHIIEVKSRKLTFTCAEDFPYDTVMVDTVQGFDQKTDKPLIYICVSQSTGSMIGLDVNASINRWSKRKTFDRVAKIPTTNYEAAKGLWVPVVPLLRRLIERP